MSHIKTFARLKPAQELYEDYEINSGKTFSLKVPELFRDYGYQAVQNRYPTISYDFQFDRVFDTPVNQEEVYNSAARDIVTGFLDGYNGTIFAYGQTGTGKTYTVEGSPLRYSDRGLAPRALTHIYKALEARGDDEDITLSISYLEIYQEVAYDLLSTTARTNSPVTVFPRVSVVEGSGGQCTVRNLSVHLAASEDVASTLLLQGQANRKVAETPVNQRSSRSHAVFTVYLAAKKRQSDVIRRSKLHLVDLAGSERVAKTGVDGQQLTEAKSINLSLHYLESVIIALQADANDHNNRPRSTISAISKGNTSLGGRSIGQEGVRRHVPYRNSLLTMVLRDSLGGNCQTSMIATISLEVHNLGETLSTCRFAQRVACISNHARRNEEIDDKTLIQQLKRRVAELETQMALLKMSAHLGENGEGVRREEDDMTSKLTDEDKLTCAQLMQEYLAGRVADPITAGITSPFKFRECLRILKRMVMSKYFQERLVPLEQPRANGSSTQASRTAPPASGNSLNGQGADREGGAMEEGQRNEQALNTQNAGDSANGASSQPVMDTDELILNIQRLYAASRREKELRQQATAQEPPSTPPKVAVARTEPYKSPYERKREKEIRKLSRKVETLKQTQSTQEQQLSEMRMSTAFGELTSMEFIIKNKIQVTREQIADQHAYLLHLRHTEASQDILQQEKLVEDQLIKREAKFQKKLDEVQQKKTELEEQALKSRGSEVKGEGQGEGEVRGQSAGKVSLEEQFSQYKKRNGTLNTRQVFDMLKSEERKHTKVSQQAETEKRFLMSKQLAMKEEATREKLRELKEMMRRSREQGFLGITASYPASDLTAPSYPTPAHAPAPDNASSAPPMAAWGDSDSHTHAYTTTATVTTSAAQAESSGFNNPTLMEKPGSQSLTLSDLDLDNNPPPEEESGSGGGGLAGRSAGKKVGEGSDAPQQQSASRSSSRADLKWEAAYTHPSSSQSIHSQDPAHTATASHANASGGSNRGGGGDGAGHGILSSINVIPSSPELVAKGERNNGAVSSNSNSSDWSETEAGTTNPQPRGRNHQGEEVMIGDSRFQRTGVEQGSSRGAAHGRSIGANRLFVDNRPDRRSSSQVYGDVDDGVDDDNGGDKSSHQHHRHHYPKPSTSTSPTVMPSEYVHSMHSRDRFDARKMGLSSKTFDSALSAMLNDDEARTTTVAYGSQFYDKYARESKPPATERSRRGVLGSRSPERHVTSVSGSSRSPERRTVMTSAAHRDAERKQQLLPPASSDLPRDHSGVHTSTWGPEAKNSSVAKRLALFLSEDKGVKPRARAETSSSTKTVKSVSFIERLTELQEQEESSPAPAVSSPRIQALQDTQRESTYMGRIQAEKERVAKIRQARQAAEAIQRAWRRHCRNSSS